MTQRIVRDVVLVFCEGDRDQVFIRHLRALYCTAQPITNPKVNVKKGRGGSADGLVQDTLRVAGAFRKRMLKLDSDRGTTEMDRAKDLANRHSIELSISDPCLEALLLKILEPTMNTTSWTSKKCKSTFQTSHIPEEKRGSPSAYKQLFSKEVLEEARQRIPELERIIAYMTTS